MTPEQRAELRRLCEAATPGKWTYEEYTVFHLDAGEIVAECCEMKDFDQEQINPQFIAASRTALPALLDETEPMNTLEAIRAQNYRVAITIEATAPAAAHGFAGKGSTVAEAVRSLGEMMDKSKQHGSG